MTTCLDGQAHHRIIEGASPDLVGTCKRCGDVQRYPSTWDDIGLARRRFRKEAKQPVSGIGGTA